MDTSDFSKRFGPILNPYVLGEDIARHRPLDRYLPPLPVGMAAKLLPDPGKTPGWLFDPFGQSPDLLIELARAGWRVLVCLNNPILRLMLELLSHPPTSDEVSHCAAILASSSKGNQRLEQHLQGLYTTQCRDCRCSLTADIYLWERGFEKPYAVVYRCPNCGSQGEFPLLPIDEQALAESQRNSLPRAWAIEKIAPPGDPLRDDASEVVNSHLERPLYFLFTLLNRLQSISLTPRERQIINGILLDVLDDATPIHQIGHTIPRPRQFMIPVRFHEHNLWNSFEQSVQHWTKAEDPVQLTTYPDLPDGPGICQYLGRVRDLAEKPFPMPVHEVFTILPRPNQAFWTLSAVWSAWLLGREEASPMAQVIARRRYDWNWHTNALTQVFHIVSKIVPDRVQIQVLLPELEPSFLVSAFDSLPLAGYECTNLAIRTEDELAQTSWRTSSNNTGQSTSILSKHAQKSSIDYLIEKGEPGEYLDMTCAAILGIHQDAQLPVDLPMTTLLQQLKAAFSNPIHFRHFGHGEQTLESGHWMLKNPPEGRMSLADRLEDASIRLLSSGRAMTIRELETELRAQIKPIFSPIREYLLHILESYAEEETPGSEKWIIKVNEHPTLRKSDQKTIRGMIANLGKQFGLDPCHTDQSVDWCDPASRTPLYRFYILANAQFNQFITSEELSPPMQILVIPGSRSNLAAYKRQQNPWLDEQLREGRHIIKYRHITRLVENPMLTKEVFDLLLDNDPTEYQPLQMQLL